MSVNLKNFESSIYGKVLERGIDYFNSGNVVSLEYDGEEWLAEVEGRDFYSVIVKLSDDGEILYSACDCPYDQGIYCKHQAAVFFELRDKWQCGQKYPKVSKKETLEDVLSTMDKETLLSIVIDIIARDKGLKNELLLRYSDNADDPKTARTIIVQSIRAASHRGFVDYQNASRATDGAYIILEMADEKSSVGKIETSISLYIIVLEEMMSLLDYCDDSSGYVGGVIDETILKIIDIIDQLSPDNINNEKVFDLIFDHALNKIYDGWTSWRISLLSALLPLCGNDRNRHKMEKHLTERHNPIEDSWSQEYENKKLQALQYEIIKEFDGETAAEMFLEQHLDNNDFRHSAIETAIKGKQYGRAERLCLDGERQNIKHIGYAAEFKRLRYEIYEKTQEVQAQKTLGMELLLNGDFDYFPKLKNLYSELEWPLILQSILKEYENGGRNNSIYIKILVHEKLKPQLMDYCQKNPYNIIRYYKHLLPEYNKEVSLILAPQIRDSAARSSSRNHYRDVCELIRHLENVSKTDAMAIRDELVEKYPRRPAFQDELSKLSFN